jgi:ComEC/Rec2-related protein
VKGILLGLSLLAGAWLGAAAVVAAAGLSLVSILQGGRRQRWSVALVGCALLGAVRVPDHKVVAIPHWAGGELTISGVVTSGPVESGRVQFFDVSAKPAGSASEVAAATLCGRAPVLPELHRGDVIQATGTITRLDDVLSRTAGSLKYRGCAGQFDIVQLELIEEGRGIRPWLDRTRRRMTASLQAAFPGDSGSLMAGLVTGDDTALAFESRQAFIVTGTSHVTAVSGSNLALIVTVWTFAGQTVRRGRLRAWRFAAVLMLWSYVAVIGPSPPPLRAALVATLALVGLSVGRKPDILTLSVVVAALQLLVRPEDFYSIAYQLSTVSAIVLVLGLGQRSPEGAKGWLRHGIVATAVTQAATSALLIPTFGTFPIYAIPANLIVAPLCGLAFPFALAASCLGLLSPTLATIVALPALPPTWLSLEAATFFASLPFADSGSWVAGLAPRWVWVALAVCVVVMLSKECRGGIARVTDDFAKLELGRRVVIGAAAAGTAVGVLAGLLAR